jgi:hypothetical protein
MWSLTVIDNPPFTDWKLPQSCVVWLTKVALLVGTITDSGPTANRPTKNLWIGRFYFDTDLQMPIWVLTVNPSVWVDATGTVV